MIEMEVGVGGCAYQFRPKDVLWGSKPVDLRAIAIY
jgi:hypothetical protein